MERDLGQMICHYVTLNTLPNYPKAYKYMHFFYETYIKYFSTNNQH